MKRVEVVDSHHKVLLAWAEFRKTLSSPPRLITLDHHTDTSPPFRHFIRKIFKEEDVPFDIKSEEFKVAQNQYLKSINFMNKETVIEAVKKLNNDEHIVAAIKTDIISSALVIAHNAANTDLEVYKEHKIICRTVNEVLSEKGKLRPDYDSVLESFLIDRSLSSFDKTLREANEELLLSEEPFILDIDLDYFNTFKSIQPKDSTSFKELVRKAKLVTVATEPEYVEKCAVDSGLDSKYLLDRFINFLK